MSRYSKNMDSLSMGEIERLHKSSVCVVGCGGLGGFIIENLARIGVLNITAVDGDVFEESNLNRQLLSREDFLGKSKALAAKERIAKVNSSVRLNAVCERLDQSNAIDILRGHDIAIDALDNIPSRFILFDACKKLNIPMIHGGINGWVGQVSTIFPDDKTLDILFGNDHGRNVESTAGNLPFTACTIASCQSAEAVKVLLGKKDILRNSFLLADLFHNDYSIIKLDGR